MLALAPLFFLALLPFLASARAGTLGISFDNDMESHLRIAEAIRSTSVAEVTGIDPAYPIGPHALCAVLAQALGVRVDYAFAGESLAVPLLLGWTALAALDRVGWLGRALVATVVGLPFLVASYYAQGSFKETMQALFVLGFALGLEEFSPAARGVRGWRLGWVPLALIVGGSLSAYSIGGLPWLLGLLALWFVVLGSRRILRGARLRTLPAELRGALLPAASALVVLIVAVVPQLPRLLRFYESTGGGSGVPNSSLGNLVGPVSFWKVFGIWDVADYRLPPSDAFHVGMYAAFGLILTLVGTVWWLRGRGWLVPLATAVAAGIWIYSDRSQSPYVAAKGLVILAPLVMLLATRWLVELRPRESWLSSVGVLRIGVAALVGWAVVGTSAKALRGSWVGPTDHVNDLRTLQPLLGRAKTLYLGWDDFIRWELAGTPVDEPYLGYPQFPLRPEKGWVPGQALDFDDIPPEILDRYRYVVGPRDPAGSQAPSNMKLVRISRYYEVWAREGPTPHRQILAEGQEPGAILDCATPVGRTLAHRHGDAAVRSPNVEVTVPIVGPGSTISVSTRLSAGTWWLSAPYVSPHPIEVTGPGLRTMLPANLDRPGNRWPIGQVMVKGTAPIVVTFSVADPTFAAPLPTYINTLVATPETPIRIVPLDRACGQYVDWYVTR